MPVSKALRIRQLTDKIDKKVSTHCSISISQRTDIVTWYYELQSPTKVQRLYNKKYGLNTAPTRNSLVRIVKKTES